MYSNAIYEPSTLRIIFRTMSTVQAPATVDTESSFKRPEKVVSMEAKPPNVISERRDTDSATPLIPDPNSTLKRIACSSSKSLLQLAPGRKLVRTLESR